MRALVRVILILSGLFSAPVYAAQPEQLYCDIPAASHIEPAVESRVHPIWHVDPTYVDLAQSEDTYVPVDYVALAGAGSARPAADKDFGVRLQNGWLLGLTYETLDTGLRIGTEVIEASVGPVYEGPMFVATWKFR